MTSKRHIVVCGAGVIGLCCAYYLRERGHRVTLVERGPPERDACSFGNAGMVVPSHATPLAAPGMVATGLKCMLSARSPFYLRPRLSADLARWCWLFLRAANAANVARGAPLLRDLQLASRALFLELAARTQNDFGLVTRGLLLLCQTEHGLAEESAAAERARALGIPIEIVSAKRAAELDPGVRMDVAGGVYYPLDCHLTPQRFMATLERLMREAGVEFRWATEIIGWKTANERVIAARTRDGAIGGDEFVIAGGSWSPKLARSLGRALPLQPGKGYSLTLPRPRKLPHLCSILAEAHVAVTPMGSTLRVGGTMELSGIDESVRPERVAAIVEAFVRYLPDFRAEDFGGVTPWHGLRPVSPDGLPYVGRSAGFENVSVATGHAMLGLSLGPITGRLIAEILSDEKTSIGLELLRPDRYG